MSQASRTARILAGIDVLVDCPTCPATPGVPAGKRARSAEEIQQILYQQPNFQRIINEQPSVGDQVAGWISNLVGSYFGFGQLGASLQQKIEGTGAAGGIPFQSLLPRGTATAGPRDGSPYPYPANTSLRYTTPAAGTLPSGGFTDAGYFPSESGSNNADGWGLQLASFVKNPLILALIIGGAFFMLLRGR